ncbi:hypothetical protein SanaruYs_15480 [Chryseotalea sanaruensis]|uniref:Uncharacterized protein n=1 Tax=Chryseotalea sanaruensis TaxID=2482724 RepID=A0A401U8W7_9BACT|nr:hypothetical protein [Chryseotalea sanaruensis]GCC51325.1 hypothetical protein SanaruYs_15480 [Chryseotalea sanaruensis]
MPSLFSNSAGTLAQNAYHSSLSPFNNNLCSGFTINDTLPATHHLQIYNLSLSALFMLAYGVLQKKIIRHTIYQVNNTTPLHERFCYELRMPYQLRHQQAHFMQQDLAQRFPHYKVHLENQFVFNPLLYPSQSGHSEVLIITQASVS